MRLCLQFPLVLSVAIFSGQSVGIWPFGSVSATKDASEPNEQYDPKIKRVAVIGAGAAGSSTAWYLQKFALEAHVDVNITVFEKNPYVGGRTRTVNAYDNPLEPVELGASIFVEVNEILKNASARFGLEPRASETETSEYLGIWNGKTFVFTQKDSSYGWWNTARILWKYGLAPIRTQRLMSQTVGKFRELYKAPWFPFRSLSESSMRLGLTNVTAMTGEQFLTSNKIGHPFTTDIIQASTRVNYASNLKTIHGLGSMVCMAIQGAMQIKGGNWQIFDSMLKESNATVLLNHTVNGISKENGKYVVKITGASADSAMRIAEEEAFDTVVMATPLQYSSLKLDDGLLERTPDEIPYVSLHVTLFTSLLTLSPQFFNLSVTDEVPNTVLTTLSPDETYGDPKDGAGSPGFFSISTLRTVTNPKTLQKEYLYKIFSPRKVTSEFLSELFHVPMPTDLDSIAIDSGDAISWYYPHVWHSYPYLQPRVTFDDPELARGFYYTSGMESFISTMETSALMGMNVAQLIVDDYRELPEEVVVPEQIIFDWKEQETAEEL